jgi:xylulokinase
MTTTLLGLDIGSSSVKTSVIDSETGKVVAQATSPNQELEIQALEPGWAEQHPDLWWEHVCKALSQIRAENPAALSAVQAIGITYQMHGLVLVDRDGKPVRSSIIWCDSRAVAIGEKAFKELGEDFCLSELGNSPGNFTAAKVAWVAHHEPEPLAKAAYMMLPGDYIAFKLTGRFGTTPSGLSEGILWDFHKKAPAAFLLEHLGVPTSLVPPISPNLGEFATIRAEVAKELGLPANTPVSYRAGDQPNNAFALGVLQPGEIGANAGTSGVIYGVTDALGVDRRSRVNNFLHVNSSDEALRVGILMCINGCGSLYRWVRANCAPDKSYAELNALAAQAPIGSSGLVALPYGNGAERTLSNRTISASFEGLQLNVHSRSHVLRAAQEGIVFALTYGLEIMRDMGLTPRTIRAGLANMFQSETFQETFATTTGAPLELLTTDGAEGAARGAGIGSSILSYDNAYRGLQRHKVVEPSATNRQACLEAYGRWKEALNSHLQTK